MFYAKSRKSRKKRMTLA